MPRIIPKSINSTQDAKNHIITTARKLFSDYSYLGTSMSDIAKKLQITKAALYHHFSGKAEIYKSVLDNAFAELSQAISEIPPGTSSQEKLRHLIKSYLDFGSKEKNLIKGLMIKLAPRQEEIINHIARLREKLLNLMQPVIEEALVGRRVLSKVDSRTLTFYLTSLMDGLLLEYSLLRKDFDSAEISKELLEILF
ncbi:MAG: TetR/AcrR family transcriptional regulator [Candidatus Saccharicenans sp.]|nr:MAG: hypothetical protein C0168_03170 [Candidatus Aminicenantes bacterium]HEK85999.1 TetR/AcrR family transcriptional regulator [Candidatus Aminicenantes bacterium]